LFKAFLQISCRDLRSAIVGTIFYGMFSEKTLHTPNPTEKMVN